MHVYWSVPQYWKKISESISCVSHIVNEVRRARRIAVGNTSEQAVRVKRRPAKHVPHVRSAGRARNLGRECSTLG